MKNIVIAILVTALCLFTVYTCQNQRASKREENSVLDAKRDTGRHYIDDAGRDHVVKQVAQADIGALKLAYTGIIDSLKAVLKLKDDQFEAMVLASSITTGRALVKVDTIYIDSTRRQYNIAYADKWLSLSGSIGLKNFIDYQVRDSMAFTFYRRKTGFLGMGKEVTFVDGYSLNPKSTITGITAMKVPAKQPGRLGIGPYVGYGYNGSKWQVNAGVSAHYSLIRF